MTGRSIFAVQRVSDDSLRFTSESRDDAESWRYRSDDRYRVVEYAPVEPWVLADERMPEPHAGQVYEVVLHENHEAQVYCVAHAGEFWGLDGDAYRVDSVFCWRPARPLGELPEGKADG